ncbi:MAG: polyphosphate:AMP phosphotransferase [Halieaceae bacterium]|jgi:polyphosphate:AMP phosphotransferase|nr:polyphosphate:AMP phosphotransferase [Halieaceae bacterium]
MFEALEVGRSVKRKAFQEAVLPLRRELLQLQFELEGRDFPVIVIVSGVEGAGKGSVVHRLNAWMDPRLIQTQAFWDHSDEEETRPYFWRFWRNLPAHGRIGIFFGSWYTRPIIQAAAGELSDAEFSREMTTIADFERMLVADGALIIKLWFHLPEALAAQRVKEDRVRELTEAHLAEVEDIDFSKRFKDLRRTSERAIRATDGGHAPWHLIESTDDNYRDLTAAQIVLQSLRDRLADGHNGERITPNIHLANRDQPTVLDRIPADAALAAEDYRNELVKLQKRLEKLAWRARKQDVACVALFEGWDAAGKGSAIRRVTDAIDPRLFQLHQFAAPTDEERAHHYLWRFWRRLGRDGNFTLFDRSWYGRVLVERVEGYATEVEWLRSYAEINRFEEQLVNHGSVVLKFWLHITPEEQLARFQAREATPHKRHKITDDDWRNRSKWDAYAAAVNDMVVHTSTADCPWTLIPGNDKRYARIEILRRFCDALSARLEK